MENKENLEQLALEQLANRLFYTVGNDGIASKESFISGYNKAKEQYSYSKQDMIDFVRFSMAKELTSDRIKNLSQDLFRMTGYPQTRLKKT